MRLDVVACAGGEVGAGYVLLPDGRRAVLTAGARAAAVVVDVARTASTINPGNVLVSPGSCDRPVRTSGPAAW